MEKVNIESLQLSQSALDVCRKTLEEVTTSCCDSTRSPRMIKAFDLIDKASNRLDPESKNTETLQSCLDDIRQLGSVIGDLHVSCCTDTREPLFQQILKQLNLAHGNVMSAMGFSH